MIEKYLSLLNRRLLKLVHSGKLIASEENGVLLLKDKKGVTKVSRQLPGLIFHADTTTS